MRPGLVSCGLLPLLLLVSTGCDRAQSSCRSAADCDAAEHCLVDHQTGEGQCIATPGRDVEPPPLRLFADHGRTDVLLVVDDGPGTAALQARLVASLRGVADLARQEDDDLRVAVTTANAISPVCDPGSEASSGALVAHSCLDRLDDFIGPDGTDARWLCTDVCSYTSEQLGLDATHPWLELLRLPEAIDAADALACLVPQGISGCEYAAPLGALRAALEREFTDDRLGWLRLDSLAEVVIVSDGVDCSLTPQGAEAFDPAGDRALWSDPEAAAPTSAVCWSAGVECEGSADGFDDCHAIDRALDGAETDSEPVLVPLSAYDTPLLMPGSFYRLHGIGGVPVDDPRAPRYSAAGDDAWLLEHGIDPGCSDDEITALPPVRLLELADDFTSACAPDYADMLGELVHREARCLSPCEAQSVEITYQPVDGEPVEIPACSGRYPELSAPDGAPACWHPEPDSPRCGQLEQPTVELVLRTAEAGHTGAFLLTPNLASPVELHCSG